jgi:SRSO17 transposase
MRSWGMSYELNRAGQERLEAYFDGIGGLLRHKPKRESFAMYALGLLGDGERKSVEPIAARVTGEVGRVRNTQRKMLHFLGGAAWEDKPIRQYAAKHALDEMRTRDRIDCSIIDDTGFLKQGRYSPGVQRQYTGSAGKTTNCQIAVSLNVCTKSETLPIDMELYLPQSWIDDKARMKAAHIALTFEYRPKWRIALDMIERAARDNVPMGPVLADSAYGDVAAFRDRVRELGFAYAVDVRSHTRVAVDGKTLSVLDFAKKFGRQAFRSITWREGTRRALRSRFAMVRVNVVNSDGKWRPEEWLLIEWPAGEDEPTHYVLSTVHDKIPMKKLVRLSKQRWRIERTYEDMKGELGLDHFEGRTFAGFNHHVTVVLCTYAFVVSERVRHFSPQTIRSQESSRFAHAA